MLKNHYYSWEELQSILNVQFTKKNNRAKLIDRNITPFYEFDIIKEGRKTVGLNIKGFKEKQKSKFIQLCEELAGFEVSFPNEETAEKLLQVLMADDKTIFNYEELGKSEELERFYTRQTISVYMQLFQRINIIPKQKQLIKSIRFDTETGELLGKALDPNKWTYYKVYKNDRKEISYPEYLEMHEYIREIEQNMLMPLIDDSNGNAKVINEHRKYCKKQAIFSCIKLFGYLPKRALSKQLTEKAQFFLKDYFQENIENEVDKIATVEESNETYEEVQSFKDLITVNEYMKVREVKEIPVIEAKELNVEEDPFTGELNVFNEDIQSWEKYNETEWANGKKLEEEQYAVPEFPVYKNGRSKALEEMLCSFI